MKHDNDDLDAMRKEFETAIKYLYEDDTEKLIHQVIKIAVVTLAYNMSALPKCAAREFIDQCLIHQKGTLYAMLELKEEE